MNYLEIWHQIWPPLLPVALVAAAGYFRGIWNMPIILKEINHKLDTEVNGINHKLDTEVNGINHKLDTEVNGINLRLNTELKIIHAQMHGLNETLKDIKITLQSMQQQINFICFAYGRPIHYNAPEKTKSQSD